MNSNSKFCVALWVSKNKFYKLFIVRPCQTQSELILRIFYYYFRFDISIFISVSVFIFKNQSEDEIIIFLIELFCQFHFHYFLSIFVCHFSPLMFLSLPPLTSPLLSIFPSFLIFFLLDYSLSLPLFLFSFIPSFFFPSSLSLIYASNFLLLSFLGYGTEVSNTFTALVHKIELMKETNLILIAEMDLKNEENQILKSKYDEILHVMQALQQEVNNFIKR